MKRIVLACVILVAIGCVGVLYWKISGLSGEKDETADWKIYRNEEYGFEIKYPDNIIKPLQGDDSVTLKHSIPFEHKDFCDLKGDGPLLNELTDFEMTIELINENFAITVMDEESDYFVLNYLLFDKLRIEPGFIDEINIGSLEKGYRVTSGVEGCGVYTYYFPVDSEYTLLVKRPFVYDLNSINEKSQENLKLPGVISPVEAEQLFNQIISTFRFLKADNPYIKLISPNGGEELVAGTKAEIEWESIGLYKKDIQLNLVFPGGGTIVIAELGSLSGTFYWDVPSDLLSSGQYKILITWPPVKSPSDVQMSDESDNYFSIVKRATNTPVEERGLKILPNSNTYTDYLGFFHVFGEVQNLESESITGVIKVILDDNKGNEKAVGFNRPSIGTILPGRTSPFDIAFQETPSFVGYQLEVTEWEKTSDDPYIEILIESKWISELPDERGFHEMKGVLRNIGDKDVGLVYIITTFYDHSGKVIDVDYSFAEKESLRVGESSSFSVFISPETYNRMSDYRIYAEGPSEDK
jgi:hypothetical protein